MSKEVLCIILLVVFFAIMIYVGFYSRKHATDVNGFVLGGRGVGPWLTAFAFGTSYFSAVIFVGYAGQFGWNFGLASTWAGLGNAFIGSLLAWNVLGRRTRIMTQHVDAKTMPDFFGKRFDSEPLKAMASVIVFIFLIPYTASLYNGLSSLFGLVFDIPYWLVILIMAVLTGFFARMNDNYHWVKPETISDSVIYRPLQAMTDAVFPYLVKAKEKIFDETPSQEETKRAETEARPA